MVIRNKGKRTYNLTELDVFILRWKGRIKQLLLRAISNAIPGESYENPIRGLREADKNFFFNPGKSKVSGGKHPEQKTTT